MLVETAHGRLVHESHSGDPDSREIERRPLYVVCEWNTTLETYVVRGQT